MCCTHSGGARKGGVWAFFLRRKNWQVNTFVATLIFIGFATIIGLSFFSSSADKLSHSKNDFRRVNIGHSLEIFGLGVTDFNNDNFLDIFSVNHAFASIFLENQGGDGFSDRFYELDMHGREHFPNANEALKAPQKNAPGIYIYWQNGTLKIETHKMSFHTPQIISLALSPGSLPQASGKLAILAHEKQLKNN